MEEVVADEVQEGTEEKDYTTSKDEEVCQSGVKLPGSPVLDGYMPMPQVISGSKELAMNNAVNQRINDEVPNPLAQLVKSIIWLTQPPSSVVPVDSIDKDTNGNCC